MANITIERLFLKFLLNNNPILQKERIKVKGKGERKPHLRFSSGCGLSSQDDFKKLFQSLNLTFEETQTEDFSKAYTLGGFVNWNGNSIGVLYGVERNGNAERKKYSPNSLKLAGYHTINPDDFRDRIINGLTDIEKDIDFRKSLISMLDNLEGKGQILSHPFLKPNINKIKSDFGEVLAAYKFCLDGYEIEFPSNSNNPGIDFWANKHPYSVKAPNGGGKVNLNAYKDHIPLTTTAGKFLYSIATHNKNDFFKYAAMLSPEVQTLANWVGGTSRDDIKKYISTCSYDDHYAKIKNDHRFTIKNQTIGIPTNSSNKSSDLTPREMWAAGNLDPFDFTLNTIVHRCWGEKETKTITEIVSTFLINASFVHVDIQNLNVILKETQFEKVAAWKTVYWSRSTKAWHNWMAVEPIKETK